MIQLPQICQTVLCVLFPTVLINPTNNQFNNQNQFNPRQSNDGKLLPINLIKLSVIKPEYEKIQEATSGSYAEAFMKQLSSINPILNATLGATKENIKPVIPFVREYWIYRQQKKPIKIYGEGTESRLPPFLEFILQRIQSYFSIYKYVDQSRPAKLNSTINDDNDGIIILNNASGIPTYQSNYYKPHIEIITDNYNDNLDNNNHNHDEGDFITVGDETEV